MPPTLTVQFVKLPDEGKATARRFLKTDSKQSMDLLSFFEQFGKSAALRTSHCVMIPFSGVQLLFQVARSLLPPEQQNRPFDITTNFPPRWVAAAVKVAVHFMGHCLLAFSKLKLCLLQVIVAIER